MLALTRKVKGKGIYIYDKRDPDRKPIKIYVARKTGAHHIRLSFDSDKQYLIVREEITEYPDFSMKQD